MPWARRRLASPRAVMHHAMTMHHHALVTHHTIVPHHHAVMAHHTTVHRTVTHPILGLGDRGYG